jgi:hypothetical protein
MALVGFRACAEFRFPESGLSAFQYVGHAWSQTAIEQLPDDLRVNMKLDGARLESSSLREFVARAQRGPESCNKMISHPNPARDALRERIVQ